MVLHAVQHSKCCSNSSSASICSTNAANGSLSHDQLNEETTDSTQAAPKPAPGTAFSPSQQATAAAPVLAPHRSAAPVQPMYHCLNEETADSTQAAPKLAHGTACSQPQQASTAAPALAPHRSKAPVHPQCITVSMRRLLIPHRLLPGLPMGLHAVRHSKHQVLLQL